MFNIKISHSNKILTEITSWLAFPKASISEQCWYFTIILKESEIISSPQWEFVAQTDILSNSFFIIPASLAFKTDFLLIS